MKAFKFLNDLLSHELGKSYPYTWRLLSRSRLPTGRLPVGCQIHTGWGSRLPVAQKIYLAVPHARLASLTSERPCDWPSAGLAMAGHVSSHETSSPWNEQSHADSLIISNGMSFKIFKSNLLSHDRTPHSIWQLKSWCHRTKISSSLSTLSTSWVSPTLWQDEKVSFMFLLYTLSIHGNHELLCRGTYMIICLYFLSMHPTPGGENTTKYTKTKRSNHCQKNPPKRHDKRRQGACCFNTCASCSRASRYTFW